MCLKRKTKIEEIITFVKESEVEVEEKLRQQEERRKEEEERLRVEEEERLRKEEEERLRKEEEERLRVEEEERLRKEEEERLRKEEEERLRKEEEERLRVEEEERLRVEEEERLRKEEEDRLRAEEEEKLRVEEEEKLRKEEEERKKKEEIYKQIGEIFAGPLQDFASNKMVSEVLIVDLTGIVIRSSAAQSGDNLGSIVADSISLLKSWKSMDYWVIEYQQGLIFIKMIARDLILVVNGGAGSNLGALKIIIDKNEKELVKALRTSEFASLLDVN
jgi:predicted regulator of Ras-like GTPase activity (Roadblock/LC7/MglB family)